MKKTTILPILILSLLFGGVVFAQEAEMPAVNQPGPATVNQAELPDPGLPAEAAPFAEVATEAESAKAGLTPDSPFYFLETIAEGIVTFFTFGDLKKAERYTALAAERLAEAKAMVEKGKLKKVGKTLKRYEKQLVKALSRAKKAKAKGKDTNETDNTIARVARNNYTALEKVLEKVPDVAKPAIRRAMMVSTKKGLEMVAETSKGKRGSLRALCIERGGGGPSEMCEKIPLQGFKSFEAEEAFCIEVGGPPEVCAAFEPNCRKMGLTTANECFLHYLQGP